MFEFFTKKDKIRFVVKHKTRPKVKSSFFDLSSKEQKAVITKAAHQANKEQSDLIKKAEKICCTKC